MAARYPIWMTRPLLIAFDFDHTIVDDNTDIVVRKLLPEEKLPESIKGMYRSDGWTAYMAKIFELLHAHSIDDAQIKAAIQNIPAVTGMERLLEELHASNCEIIIISDSNTLFIDHWLKYKALDNFVAKVFTNPARFDEKGLLRIDMYHLQDWCTLSTKNLCKGDILASYINKRLDEGVKFDRVAYVGDGKNDYCPVLRLSDNDLAFPRIGYALIKILDNTGNDGSPGVGAEVISWNDATDISRELSRRLSNFPKTLQQ